MLWFGTIKEETICATTLTPWFICWSPLLGNNMDQADCFHTVRYDSSLSERRCIHTTPTESGSGTRYGQRDSTPTTHHSASKNWGKWVVYSLWGKGSTSRKASTLGWSQVSVRVVLTSWIMRGSGTCIRHSILESAPKKELGEISIRKFLYHRQHFCTIL